MTTVIVAAAGEGTRWNNYTGVPKHLLKIDGERLIDRTSKQFNEFKTFIVCPSDRRYITPFGDEYIPTQQYLNPTGTSQDKILASYPIWDKKSRTIILLGDVWFSDYAVETIKAPIDDITFYGRFGPSKITGTPYGELFALSFPHTLNDKVYEASMTVARMFKEGKIVRAYLWELYGYLQGFDPPTKHIKANNFVEINDWTDDFDFPKDLDRWLDRRKAQA